MSCYPNELLGYELSGKLIVFNFILIRAFIVCAVGIKEVFKFLIYSTYLLVLCRYVCSFHNEKT